MALIPAVTVAPLTGSPDARLLTVPCRVPVAHAEIVRICEAQLQLVAMAGRKKAEWTRPTEDEALVKKIRKDFTSALEDAHRKPGNKLARNKGHKGNKGHKAARNLIDAGMKAF